MNRSFLSSITLPIRFSIKPPPLNCVAFKPPRVVSFSPVCYRSSTRNKRTHHPYLIEPKGRQTSSNTRRNSTRPEDGGFGSCLCFLHLGEGGWLEIGGDTPIIREMQLRRLGGLRAYNRGYAGRALGARPQACTRLCGPARSAPLSLITDAVPSSAVRIFDIAQLPA